MRGCQDSDTVKPLMVQGAFSRIITTNSNGYQSHVTQENYNSNSHISSNANPKISDKNHNNEISNPTPSYLENPILHNSNRKSCNKIQCSKYSNRSASARKPSDRVSNGQNLKIMKKNRNFDQEIKELKDELNETRRRVLNERHLKDEWKKKCQVSFFFQR